MLQDLTARLDNASSKALLLVNAAIAGLIAVAHGGALAFTFYKATDDQYLIRCIASVSLPLAALILASTAVAYTRAQLAPRVLTVHALILLATALGAVVWGLSLVVSGTTSRNFHWAPGLLSLFVSYSAYLFRRYWLGSFIQRWTAVRHLHVFAFFCTFALELAIMVRLVIAFTHRAPPP